MYYRKAVDYALKKLQQELPEKLYYHGIHHTLDVCRAVQELASGENISGEEYCLLSTAAVYHDLGFVERYGDNEPVAVRIARECLPEFNYSPQQVDIVARIILATRIPHRPQTLMEQIMCDADLDYLGRTDFFEISRTLQQEWMAYGLISSEDEWNEKQILFFRQHQYFTATAREKRQQLKNRHLQEIIQCMKNK